MQREHLGVDARQRTAQAAGVGIEYGGGFRYDYRAASTLEAAPTQGFRKQPFADFLIEFVVAPGKPCLARKSASLFKLTDSSRATA